MAFLFYLKRSRKYIHSTPTFSIYNPGDVDVDPRIFPLSIKYIGASTNLKIKNITTNEEWSHTGTSLVGDTIELTGVRSLKNNLSIFRNTNRRLITIKRGWNDFTLTGTSGTFSTSFDFRIYNL